MSVGAEAVLYEERRGTLHLLNPTAATIWLSCDGETSIGKVVADLASLYCVDESEIAHDVGVAVQELEDLGLVQSGARTGQVT